MIDPLNRNDRTIFNLKAGDPARKYPASRVEVGRAPIKRERHPVRVSADHDLTMSVNPVDDAVLEFPLLALQWRWGLPFPQEIP